MRHPVSASMGRFWPNFATPRWPLRALRAVRCQVRAQSGIDTAWGSRCQSSGAIATGFTSRAARSTWASGRRGTELPDRAERIREGARGGRGPDRACQPSTRTRKLWRSTIPRSSSTSARRGTSGRQAGSSEDPGQDRVVPYLFPHPGLVGSLPVELPADVAARAGTFCFDTMTLIGPGTWDAARAALDVALTAADLVAGGARARLRALPASGSPRDAKRVRRLVLPQQLGRGGRPDARRAWRAGRAHRHRRPPRQRRASRSSGKTPRS